MESQLKCMAYCYPIDTPIEMQRLWFCPKLPLEFIKVAFILEYQHISSVNLKTNYQTGIQNTPNNIAPLLGLHYPSRAALYFDSKNSHIFRTGCGNG